MQGIVVGLGPADFILGTSNFLAAVAYSRVRTLKLSRKFGYLQNREHLPGANPVTDVHVDVADVARNLGMEFHFLIGQELSRDGEGIGKWRTPNLYDGCARGGIS